jgi:hypothetical protein
MASFSSDEDTSYRAIERGTTRSQLFGYILNEHGARAATHNLTPIEQMVAPEDQSQLRSVLGLFQCAL